MDYNSKYRPQELADVVGQPQAVRHLRRLLHLPFENLPRVYLFAGPSGVGKTSAARIFARKLGAKQTNIQELDAASHGSLPELRELVSKTRHRTLDGSPRVIIIDEAHQLDVPAWDSLLKPIEETPPHLFWIFCSTDPKRIKNTAADRMQSLVFRSIPEGVIKTQLSKMRAQEESLSHLTDDDLKEIAHAGRGSLRASYALLEGAQGIEDPDELREYLAVPESNPATKKLLRQLVEYPTARQQQAIMGILNDFSDYDPEMLRIALCKYAYATLMSASEETNHLQILLSHFTGEDLRKPEGFPAFVGSLLAYWSKFTSL